MVVAGGTGGAIADGTGIVSHAAGGVLLTRTLRATGLGVGLAAALGGLVEGAAGGA